VGEAPTYSLATQIGSQLVWCSSIFLDEASNCLHPAAIIERLNKIFKEPKRFRKNSVIVVEHDIRYDEKS